MNQGILIESDSFSILEKGKVVIAAKWTEIEEITAFKRDLITTDLICLDFTVNTSDGLKYHFETNEEVPFFDDLVIKLEALFPIDKTWRENIVLPPFATNRMTLLKTDGNMGFIFCGF